MVHPVIYMKSLLDRYTALAGTFERKKINCLDELLTGEDDVILPTPNPNPNSNPNLNGIEENDVMIVNCTGIGAREVVSDTQVIGARGATLKLKVRLDPCPLSNPLVNTDTSP